MSSRLVDLICHLSPSFWPDLFCRFSLFHLGTTITLSHIVLSMWSIKRRDLKTHARWTFWVMVGLFFVIRRPEPYSDSEICVLIGFGRGGRSPASTGATYRDVAERRNASLASYRLDYRYHTPLTFCISLQLLI